MEINTVAVVGLGALGTLFGHHLSQHMPFAQLRIIADTQRIARYQRDGVFSNGQLCRFQYVSPQEQGTPADLILVAVKSTQLNEALADIARQVGPDTLILSLLNGITSEGIIAARYGATRVVPCIAYGMDAVKENNRLTFRNMGKLCIGTENGGPPTRQVQRVARFFDSVNLPHEVDEHMPKRLWGKFMLNVGVNQTVALFGPNYGAIQQDGPQRDTMIAAMREVLSLSVPEKVNLTEADLAYWLHVLSTLNPEGKPSMRQDVEARRPSEVALFAGTVIDLAQKHGLAVPVNRMLFERITEIEAAY